MVSYARVRAYACVDPTGFSDPVYAEAYVNVHQFDINLGMLYGYVRALRD